jgi:hypothetical protein
VVTYHGRRRYLFRRCFLMRPLPNSDTLGGREENEKVTGDQARQAILHHASPVAGSDSDAGPGFLETLRPYRGRLEARTFHEIMAALRVLAPELNAGASVARDIVAALFAISYFGRLWGVEPDGMLRRNGLISESDIATLSRWINCIDYAVVCLLDGGDIEGAFDEYRTLEQE